MKQPPIWRDANQLLLEVEQVVRNFSRYHKYAVGIGTDLRKQSMGLVRPTNPNRHEELRMIKILIIAVSLLMVQMASAQICKDTIPASTPDSRFVVNGDEVTDTGTGLIWQRCSLGQSGSDCRYGSSNNYTWQQALQTASAPWRLPSIKELRSIVEEKCYDPAINLTIFPNTPSFFYWSASPSAYSSSIVWYVLFSTGHSHGDDQSWGNYVRLVRGGQ